MQSPRWPGVANPSRAETRKPACWPRIARPSQVDPWRVRPAGSRRGGVIVMAWASAVAVPPRSAVGRPTDRIESVSVPNPVKTPSAEQGCVAVVVPHLGVDPGGCGLDGEMPAPQPTTSGVDPGGCGLDGGIPVPQPTTSGVDPEAVQSGGPRCGRRLTNRASFQGISVRRGGSPLVHQGRTLHSKGYPLGWRS